MRNINGRCLYIHVNIQTIGNQITKGTNQNETKSTYFTKQIHLSQTKGAVLKYAQK